MLTPKERTEELKKQRLEEQEKKKKQAVLNKPFPYIVMPPSSFILESVVTEKTGDKKEE